MDLIGSNSRIHFLGDKNGKLSLIFNNLFQLCDRIRNTNVCKLCENRGECQERLTQKTSEEPILAATHNHDSDENQNKQKLVITNLKHQICEYSNSIRRLFRGELVNRFRNEHNSACTQLQFYQIISLLDRSTSATYLPFPKIRRRSSNRR